MASRGYNLHPFSDCPCYHRNGKGAAFRTSERQGEMPYHELREYLLRITKPKPKPRGRVIDLRKKPNV